MKLAYPVIIGMLGHTIIGIVDNVMVGKLGATELAAVSLGNSILFVAMSVGIGFSTAITPLISEANAENDSQKVKTVFHHGLFLCTVLGFLLFFAIVFAQPVMGLLHQKEEVIELAKPYLYWVAFSMVPLIIYQGYKQFADGLSLTKYSMYAIVMANIVHVILNYVFIYGIWIFPKMGIIGAALGTVISRILMLLFMHVILYKKEKLKHYFQGFQWNQVKKAMLSKIINLGYPSAMQMVFECVLFTSAIWLCGSIDKNNQAANQIALSLASMAFMSSMGLSVVAMIRVGNYKGLQDYKNLVVVARSIFLLTIIIQIGLAALFVIFHKIVPYYFLNMENAAQLTDNAIVIAIASKLLIIAAVFQLSDGIQVVALGSLRGLQDVKMPMYITFIAYWLIGFPVSFYLGKYTHFKAVGVWLGLCVGLTAAASFLYLRFHFLTKKLNSN
jgi:multidrug resistance protein, MATE family